MPAHCTATWVPLTRCGPSVVSTQRTRGTGPLHQAAGSNQGFAWASPMRPPLFSTRLSGSSQPSGSLRGPARPRPQAAAARRRRAARGRKEAIQRCLHHAARPRGTCRGRRIARAVRLPHRGLKYFTKAARRPCHDGASFAPARRSPPNIVKTYSAACSSRTAGA